MGTTDKKSLAKDSVREPKPDETKGKGDELRKQLETLAGQMSPNVKKLLERFVDPAGSVPPSWEELRTALYQGKVTDVSKVEDFLEAHTGFNGRMAATLSNLPTVKVDLAVLEELGDLGFDAIDPGAYVSRCSGLVAKLSDFGRTQVGKNAKVVGNITKAAGSPKSYQSSADLLRSLGITPPPVAEPVKKTEPKKEPEPVPVVPVDTKPTGKGDDSPPPTGGTATNPGDDKKKPTLTPAPKVSVPDANQMATALLNEFKPLETAWNTQLQPLLKDLGSSVANPAFWRAYKQAEKDYAALGQLTLVRSIELKAVEQNTLTPVIPPEKRGSERQELLKKLSDPATGIPSLVSQLETQKASAGKLQEAISKDIPKLVAYVSDRTRSGRDADGKYKPMSREVGAARAREYMSEFFTGRVAEYSGLLSRPVETREVLEVINAKADLQRAIQAAVIQSDGTFDSGAAADMLKATDPSTELTAAMKASPNDAARLKAIKDFVIRWAGNTGIMVQANRNELLNVQFNSFESAHLRAVGFEMLISGRVLDVSAEGQLMETKLDEKGEWKKSERADAGTELQLGAIGAEGGWGDGKETDDKALESIKSRITDLLTKAKEAKAALPNLKAQTAPTQAVTDQIKGFEAVLADASSVVDRVKNSGTIHQNLQKKAPEWYQDTFVPLLQLASEPGQLDTTKAASLQGEAQTLFDDQAKLLATNLNSDLSAAKDGSAAVAACKKAAAGLSALAAQVNAKQNGAPALTARQLTANFLALVGSPSPGQQIEGRFPGSHAADAMAEFGVEYQGAPKPFTLTEAQAAAYASFIKADQDELQDKLNSASWGTDSDTNTYKWAKQIAAKTLEHVRSVIAPTNKADESSAYKQLMAHFAATYKGALETEFRKKFDDEPEFQAEILPLFGLERSAAVSAATSKDPNTLSIQQEQALAKAAGAAAQKILEYHDDTFGAVKDTMKSVQSFFAEVLTPAVLGNDRPAALKALKAAYQQVGGSLEQAVVTAIGAKHFISNDLDGNATTLLSDLGMSREALLNYVHGPSKQVDTKGRKYLEERHGIIINSVKGIQGLLNAWTPLSEPDVGAIIGHLGTALKAEPADSTNTPKTTAEELNEYFLGRYHEIAKVSFFDHLKKEFTTQSKVDQITAVLGRGSVTVDKDQRATELKNYNALVDLCSDIAGDLNGHVFGNHYAALLKNLKAASTAGQAAVIETKDSAEFKVSGVAPTNWKTLFLKAYREKNGVDFVVSLRKEMENYKEGKDGSGKHAAARTELAAWLQAELGLNLDFNAASTDPNQQDLIQNSAALVGTDLTKLDMSGKKVRPEFTATTALSIAENIHTIAFADKGVFESMTESAGNHPVAAITLGILAGPFLGLYAVALAAGGGQHGNRMNAIGREIQQLLPDERDTVDEMYRVRFGHSVMADLAIGGFDTDAVKSVMALKEGVGEELKLSLKQAVGSGKIDTVYTSLQGAKEDEKQAVLADVSLMGWIRSKVDTDQYERIYKTLNNELDVTDMLRTRAGFFNDDEKGADADIKAHLDALKSKIHKIYTAMTTANTDEAKAQADVEAKRLRTEYLKLLNNPDVIKVAEKMYNEEEMARFRSIILEGGSPSNDEKIATASRGLGTSNGDFMAALRAMSPQERAAAASNPDIRRRISTEFDAEKQREALNLLFGTNGEADIDKAHYEKINTDEKTIFTEVAKMDFATWSALRNNPARLAQILTGLGDEKDRNRFRELMKLDKQNQPQDTTSMEPADQSADAKNKASANFYRHMLVQSMVRAAERGVPDLLAEASRIYKLSVPIQKDLSAQLAEKPESSEEKFKREVSEGPAGDDLLSKKDVLDKTKSVRELVAEEVQSKGVYEATKRWSTNEQQELSLNASIANAILKTADPAAARFGEHASQIGADGCVARRIFADKDEMKKAITEASDETVLVEFSNLNVFGGVFTEYRKAKEAFDEAQKLATPAKPPSDAAYKAAEFKMKAFVFDVGTAFDRQILATTATDGHLDVRKTVRQRIVDIVGANAAKNAVAIARAMLKLPTPIVISQADIEAIGGEEREERNRLSHGMDDWENERTGGLYNAVNTQAATDYDAKAGAWKRSDSRTRAQGGEYDAETVKGNRETAEGARVDMNADRDMWANVAKLVAATIVSTIVTIATAGSAAPLAVALMGAAAGAVTGCLTQYAIQGENRYDLAANLVKDTTKAVVTAALTHIVGKAFELIGNATGLSNVWAAYKATAGAMDAGANKLLRTALIDAAEATLSKAQGDMVGMGLTAANPISWRHGWRSGSTVVGEQVGAQIAGMPQDLAETFVISGFQSVGKNLIIDRFGDKVPDFMQEKKKDPVAPLTTGAQTRSTPRLDAALEAAGNLPSHLKEGFLDAVKFENLTDVVVGKAVDWLATAVKDPQQAFRDIARTDLNLSSETVAEFAKTLTKDYITSSLLKGMSFFKKDIATRATRYHLENRVRERLDADPALAATVSGWEGEGPIGKARASSYLAYIGSLEAKDKAIKEAAGYDDKKDLKDPVAFKAMIDGNVDAVIKPQLGQVAGTSASLQDAYVASMVRDAHDPAALRIAVIGSPYRSFTERVVQSAVKALDEFKSLKPDQQERFLSSIDSVAIATSAFDLDADGKATASSAQGLKDKVVAWKAKDALAALTTTSSPTVTTPTVVTPPPAVATTPTAGATP